MRKDKKRINRKTFIAALVILASIICGIFLYFYKVNRPIPKDTYAIKINSVVYQMPIPYSDISDTVKIKLAAANKKITVKKMTYSNELQASYNGLPCTVKVSNESNKDERIQQSKIFFFDFPDLQKATKKQKQSFILPCNISLASSQKQIETAYGKPKQKYSIQKTNYETFRISKNINATFGFFEKNHQIISLKYEPLSN
jgi:RecG-like helicase